VSTRRVALAMRWLRRRLLNRWIALLHSMIRGYRLDFRNPPRPGKIAMIVYLHGLQFLPASGKARQLGEHMVSIGRQTTFIARALPNSPREAIAPGLRPNWTNVGPNRYPDGSSHRRLLRHLLAERHAGSGAE